MLSAEVVRRSVLATSDPEQVRAVLDQIYEIDTRLSAPPETRWDLTISYTAVPDFSTIRLRIPGLLDVATHGEQDVVFATMTGGACGMQRGQDVDRYEIGDLFISSAPDVEWQIACQHIATDSVTMPISVLTETVDNDPDHSTSGGWTFTAQPPGVDDARAWRRATRFVDDLLADPARLTPLTLSAATRLLAATALSTFPNTAVTATTIEDRRDAHPGALRRAVSFIEANPDLDITVHDIARAAFVTPRALQLAFRRHLNITPMAYLRQVRLDRVRAELREAHPAGTTVTEVAARWGFADPSRFSAQYRAAYGESPRQTLRRR